MSDSSNPSIDLQAEVLSHPVYIEHCQELFKLFCLSREVGKDPHQLLGFQRITINYLLEYQQKRREFKQQGKLVESVVAKRLALIVQQIVDSLVWRVLEADRVRVQLLAEHPRTGHLDNTVFSDFVQAKHVVEERGVVVLVNDLTTILRHADLTIVDENGLSLQENKSSASGGKGSRAHKQIKRLKELDSFLKTNLRVDQNRRDFIFRSQVPIKGYHDAAAAVIIEAKKHGYHRVQVSDSLVIDACYAGDARDPHSDPHPFKDMENVTWSHNFEIFDEATPRLAPYTIFPMDNRSCFDILVGEVLLRGVLNLEQLQSQYSQAGLTLEFPQLSPKEAETYFSASIAERQRLKHNYKYILKDDTTWLSITPDMFMHIDREFLHEDMVIETHRQIVNFIKSVGIYDDKNTRFYISYGDESNLWA
jgi:hypothetical protein